jgi:mono/diheme cytochrome c family protein
MLRNRSNTSRVGSPRTNLARLAIFIFAVCVLGAGCGVRYDMQDQPRYRPYKKSEFFADGRSSREHPEGTVARGQLFDDKALYTGKIDNPITNAVSQTAPGPNGTTVVSTFPNAIDEFPMPVTKELINRGQERFNIYCIVCHGPVGNGDGMIVRRGFTQPPTYHDDRLRNAPVGHFFDVITNGWGKMNSYAYQVSPADRWAIVAYIRTLQVSQNPNQASNMSQNNAANTAPGGATSTPEPVTAPGAETDGGHR